MSALLDPRMTNGYQKGAVALPAAEAQLIARREAVLGPAYRLFYERPLHFTRGEGVWLFDAEGRRYLDFYNNVASLGHCHSHVQRALAGQAAVLSTHTRYLGAGVVDLAERLVEKLPSGLGHVMFTCTGSEANDLALRIARAATGGTGVVVTEDAYHGVTLATVGLSTSLGPAVAPGEGVYTVPAPHAANYPNGVAAGFAAAVRGACAKMREDGLRPAALIVDTIFSSDGVLPVAKGVLNAAAVAIRAEGGLFIADEVQPGFARTGEAFWGCAREEGLVPDMVSMGKPMGNGYPMAALAVRPEWLAAFGAHSRYFNTFGGNTVAAAVGAAVLEVIEAEGLQANALRQGAALRAGFEALAARYPCLGEIRGVGLFWGVDILEDAQPSRARAAAIVNGLAAAGVLISATGPLGHVLKIRPPLVVEAAHVATFLERFDTVLSGLT